MSLRKLAAFATSAALVLVPLGASAQTVNGLAIKDGNGTGQSLCTYILTGAFQISCYAPHYYNGTSWIAAPADSSGRPIVTGASGALALDATVAGLQISQGSTTSGQKGGLILGAVTTAGPTYTTGQSSPLSLDTAGNLRVNVVAGGAGGGAVTAAASSYAAGAFSVGAGTDGWNVTEGTKADAAYTGSGSASLVAILKGIYASATGAIPAGTSIIGKVGIDQTTPGTTNGVQDAADGSTGSAVPSKATYAGAVSSGNLTGLIQADNSAAISVSTATTTQLVALTSGKKIYVTAFDIIAAGTGNATLVYGTGSNCGTGTTSLTGAYNLTAQTGISKGIGLGPVLVVPASNALCITTSAAVQMSGSVAYTQF